MKLYQEFHEQWEETRRRKLAHNTYLERDEGADGPVYSVRLHATRIVKAYPDGSIELIALEWKTPTTKERMNRYLPAGFNLYQDRGEWIVARGGWNAPDSQRYAFADGMRILESGEVTGAGIFQTARERRALLKSLGAFADTYIEKLANGGIPAPSGGDCWGCSMKATDGTYPMGRDCIPMHIEEGYFVPSLIVRALGTFPCAQVANDMLHAFWVEPDSKRAAIYREGGPWSLRANGGTGRGMGHEFLRKPLMRLLKRAHGIAG